LRGPLRKNCYPVHFKISFGVVVFRHFIENDRDGDRVKWIMEYQMAPPIASTTRLVLLNKKRHLIPILLVDAKRCHLVVAHNTPKIRMSLLCVAVQCIQDNDKSADARTCHKDYDILDKLSSRLRAEFSSHSDVRNSIQQFLQNMVCFHFKSGLLLNEFLGRILRSWCASASKSVLIFLHENWRKPTKLLWGWVIAVKKTFLKSNVSLHKFPDHRASRIKLKDNA